MKIILADDHALFRGGFGLLLQKMEGGAQVLEAGSFPDAMALAGLHPDTELMLLDLNMPGMNGAASIEQSLAAHPQVPIVVMSANDTRHSVQVAMAAGASGYIPKTSSPEIMQSAIQLVLSGGVYLPPQILHPGHEGDQKDAGRGVASRLTGRQLDVLRLLADGLSNKQICRALDLGEGTIKVHIAAIFRGLNVSNRTEAAVAARRLGLLG